MTVGTYDVHFLKATINVHVNMIQSKNDQERFTAERISVCRRIWRSFSAEVLRGFKNQYF